MANQNLSRRTDETMADYLIRVREKYDWGTALTFGLHQFMCGKTSNTDNEDLLHHVAEMSGIAVDLSQEPDTGGT
jgi:hypothetical protein